MKNHSQKLTWHEIHPIQPGATKGYPKKHKSSNTPFCIHTYTPLPAQARILTCPPVDDSGLNTIRSDDGGHRGTGGGGGEEQGWIVGEGVYTVCTERYLRWEIRVCQVTGGGEVYVCARDGMHVRYIFTI
jgi:hypothetical protein